MATHDYVIANGSGGAVRSDLNNALAAIVSNNSSATEPTTTYAYMWWADTTSGQLKLRNGADSAWVVIRELDGTMLMESGTAGAPGLAFASDLDTGIYSPSANQLAISTGGNGRLFINNTGLVGIGTSNPSNSLHVFNSTADVILKVESGDSISRIELKDSVASNYISTVGTNLDFAINGVAAAMRITSAGSVGIGTTSPAALLDVNGAGLVTNLLIRNNAGTPTLGTTPQVYSPASGALAISANSFERLRIDSSGRLLVGTTIEPTAGDGQYGKLVVQGYIGGDTGAGYMAIARGQQATAPFNNTTEIGRLAFTDSLGNSFAYISSRADGDTGSGDYPGRLVFSTTADGSASPTERMRITSDAEVLIGTEDPIQPTTSTQNGVEINATAKRIKASRDGGAPLTLQRTSSDGDIADFYRDTTLVGSISVTTSATAYNTSSDYRLKENVVALTGAADRVNQLQVHRFNFIADPDTTVDGFLAHEAQAVVPEAVTGTHDGVDADGNPVYQGIDQSKLVPLLTAALQEALAEIESLKARVTALEP